MNKFLTPFFSRIHRKSEKFSLCSRRVTRTSYLSSPRPVNNPDCIINFTDNDDTETIVHYGNVTPAELSVITCYDYRMWQYSLWKRNFVATTLYIYFFFKHNFHKINVIDIMSPRQTMHLSKKLSKNIPLLYLQMKVIV